ncbi:DUF4365 domain-containing protein [Chryseobacterium sp. RG1]|uniref:DUF4365 domain-containing protein n=1 Tax=Chryseobacterium tagetis TaxID=2801334 RepID=A0ABS8A296_9FLAO|nr:DUF4365 domain-containing protein [Chryseobacterium tagetis]MCA6068106.1 DUF4365 domain-containing protein [Chryseobacterium tagetis]
MIVNKVMNRYNPTERLGVNETEKIVIQNLGWIFREQPIVDVGLDAIIEQVENDEPTGKFIAVQIKSGSGNFYKTQKGLSYYVTNIHYNYWLNLSIPIILIAHIPEEGKTYWQEIIGTNLKRNKKSWKIEIPFKQEFNEKSEKRLTKIASVKNDKRFDIYRGRVDSNNIKDIIEDLRSLNNATDCLSNIAAIIEKQTKETINMGDKLKELSLKNTPNAITEFSILYKGISRTMNITTKRIETEVELFSQLYSVGITSFEKFLITQYTFILKLEEFTGSNTTQLPIEINSILSEYVDLKETLKVNFKQLPNQIDSAVSEYINLRETLKNTPTHNFSFFKEAKNQLVEVLSFLIHEFQDAKGLTTRILEKL